MMSTFDPDPAPGAQGPPPAQPPANTLSTPQGAAADQAPARGGLVIGLMLVVAGGAVIAARLFDVTLGPHAWPLWILVPGLALLVGSFLIQGRSGLGLASPGAIVTMVGLVLLVQDRYGLYATWAYAWALVAPTAPGLGMLLYGLVKGDRQLAADGTRLTLVGLSLFVGFGLFFEGLIGLSGHRIANLDEVLPYVAIGLGVLLVMLSLLGRGRQRHA